MKQHWSKEKIRKLVSEKMIKCTICLARPKQKKNNCYHDINAIEVGVLIIQSLHSLSLNKTALGFV